MYCVHDLRTFSLKHVDEGYIVASFASLISKLQHQHVASTATILPARKRETALMSSRAGWPSRLSLPGLAPSSAGDREQLCYAALSEDCLTCHFEGRQWKGTIVLQAERCIPASAGAFYFEVKVVDPGAGSVAIGLVPEFHKPGSELGYARDSAFRSQGRFGWAGTPRRCNVQAVDMRTQAALHCRYRNVK